MTHTSMTQLELISLDRSLDDARRAIIGKTIRIHHQPHNFSMTYRWEEPADGRRWWFGEYLSDDDDTRSVTTNHEHDNYSTTSDNSDNSIIMGVTIKQGAVVELILAAADETCCLCWDDIQHQDRCFKTPCNHIICHTCATDPRFNVCPRCNQTVTTMTPVKAVKVKIE